MSVSDVPPEVAKEVARRAVLAGVERALGLPQRMRDLLRARGWPADDEDLVSVLSAAVACVKMRAGRTKFRRPPAGAACSSTWLGAGDARTATQIVDLMELSELLEPR